MNIDRPQDTVKGKVLLAEDDLMQRELLAHVVRGHGYDVITVSDGDEALQHLRICEPDVVLSDIVMPGIDGLELCRIIKNDSSLSHIPVILLSALSEKHHMIKGIEAGANEFLTKPVDPQEVGLRLRNAIHSKRLFEDLRTNYFRLRDMEALRDKLTHMIVHDMRSILMGISGNAELLSMSAGQKLNEKETSYLDNIMTNTFALVEMISTVLDVSRIESGSMPLYVSNVDIREVVNRGLELLGLQHRQKRLTVHMPSTPVIVPCDPEIICRVITNLVANALKYTEGLDDGHISVSVREEGKKVLIAVTDNGPGIPPEDHVRIFDKFVQARSGVGAGRHSSGMGLYFCKLAVESHGGNISVQSQAGRGATFLVELKAVNTAGRE